VRNLRVVRFRNFVLLVLAGGASLPPSTAPAFAQGARVAIAWSEANGASAVQAFDVVAPWPAVTPALPVDPGSRLHRDGDTLYAVSSAAGTVTVIDTVAWEVEETYFLGAESRPIGAASTRTRWSSSNVRPTSPS
jgi:hypothetical protein